MNPQTLLFFSLEVSMVMNATFLRPLLKSSRRPSPRTGQTPGWLYQIPLSTLLPCSSLAFGAYILHHELLWPTLTIAAGCGLFLHREISQGLGKLHRSLGNPLVVQGLICVVLAVLLLLDTTFMPAQAQFMRGAETFLGKFISDAGMSSKVNDLIFGTLRGIFLLYLAISIIRVVQAARNDEDWQTLARTPLIIVVSIVVADVLTGLIVGTKTP